MKITENVILVDILSEGTDLIMDIEAGTLFNLFKSGKNIIFTAKHEINGQRITMTFKVLSAMHNSKSKEYLFATYPFTMETKLSIFRTTSANRNPRLSM